MVIDNNKKTYLQEFSIFMAAMKISVYQSLTTPSHLAYVCMCCLLPHPLILHVCMCVLSLTTPSHLYLLLIIMIPLTQCHDSCISKLPVPIIYMLHHKLHYHRNYSIFTTGSHQRQTNSSGFTRIPIIFIIKLFLQNISTSLLLEKHRIRRVGPA